MSQRVVEQIRQLPGADFRRLLGVRPETFSTMLEVLERREQVKKKKGRPPDLGLEEQLVLALQFWREYRTHYHLAVEWQVAENTVRRTTRAGGRCAHQVGRFRAARVQSDSRRRGAVERGRR
jgi:Mn-dependent DtxR family transcriptional regulator